MVKIVKKKKRNKNIVMTLAKKIFNAHPCMTFRNVAQRERVKWPISHKINLEEAKQTTFLQLNIPFNA